jgi:uncharacterized membrane protein (UPF0182 family)
MAHYQVEGRRGERRMGRWIIAAVIAVLLGARTIASTVIEYQWWKEVGQVDVWMNLIGYGVAPVVVASLIAFAALWLAIARGVKFGGSRLGAMPTVAKVVTAGALLVGIIVAVSSIDTWAVIRYFGSRGVEGAAAAWRDPVFGRQLSFYLFDLPFFRVLHGYVLAVSIVVAVGYWLSARAVQLKEQLPYIQRSGEIDLTLLRLERGLESSFLRIAATVFFIALAISYFLDRYELLTSDHGYMVGIDFVDEKIRLPLLWVSVVVSLAAPVAVMLRKWLWLLAIPALILIQAILPRIITAVYVRPNEIAIQQPYIEKHIQATRSAFGLNRRVKEIESPARIEGRIQPAKHKPMLENVRLWDWRAFHDTVTQIQALRPYYVFNDSDVDRYIIDGGLQQVLLTPRELDLRQLPDARTRWINPHFVYTHGYGVVMAEANRITADGLPYLLVQDAPPKVSTKSLKLARPEIYYGEVVHEPVFVRSGQQEFSYPSGNDSVFTRYDGQGGIPMSSFFLRLAAALREADHNIILTGLIQPETRYMIRRRVADRLETIAGFIQWDIDPYLVLTDEGHLVWTVDGYTTSDAHPYSHRMEIAGRERLNYMRNAVKATVDAYTGEVNLYIFDEGDPIIEAYRRLFPTLLKPASAMPASLRQHARYPETLFRVQAEIYRTYHMQNPQAFYNKEDVWDVARNVYGSDNRPQPVAPTYVIATLPGESEPEFLLILPFTPRNKDNLIGLMVARCDGPALGELTFLQLSKQALMFGPMQIEARINQDQIIAKDLSLWNQQGSQVLRGQMLALPIEDSFLYVEPIYIQASEARMPQLKKVVLAMGNTLIYRDTYDQALAELAGLQPAPPAASVVGTSEAPPPPTVAGSAAPSGRVEPDRRVERIRSHLQRYRDLSSQGKWAEAGKELEAIEGLVRQ